MFIKISTKEIVDEQTVRNATGLTVHYIEDFHLYNKDFSLLIDSEKPFVEEWQEIKADLIEGTSGTYFLKYSVLDRATPTKKEVIRQRIANKRFEEEVSGTEWNGYFVPTDRNTQSILTSMNLRVDRDPAYTEEFKISNDVWVTLDREKIVALGDVVFGHVSQCFKRERELSELLESGQNVTEEDW